MENQNDYSRAIAELNAGRKASARAILAKLVQVEPHNAEAWLLLATCFDQPERQIYCLKQVLKIDPNNRQAIQALDRLQGRGEEPAGDSQTMDATPAVSAAPTAAPLIPPASQYRSSLSSAQDSFIESLDQIEPRSPAAAVDSPPMEAQPDQTAAAAKTPPVRAGESLEWYQVWLMAIALPSEGAFQRILRDPNAKPSRGYLWVFITALISAVANIILISLQMDSILQNAVELYPDLGSLQQVMGYILLGFLIVSPFLAVIGVIITAGLYQVITKFMIGEGTFSEMVYALCAITAPLSLIVILVNLPIPFIRVLGFVIGLYSLFLNLMAIKAVNRLSWGLSCATVVILPVLLGICGCLGFLLIMPTSGPMFESRLIPALAGLSGGVLAPLLLARS